MLGDVLRDTRESDWIPVVNAYWAVRLVFPLISATVSPALLEHTLPIQVSVFFARLAVPPVLMEPLVTAAFLVTSYQEAYV